METGIVYRCNTKAYEGDKPYIFVSYAHKESEIVFSIIERLSEKGYRIWYDDGISPGSEWPEYIASHLNGCEVCLAFISPISANSPNCRKEINFALSKNKSFIGVFLSETDLSLGLEMQISTHQCVKKYEYSDENEFYNKLTSSVELSLCRDESATTASKFLDKINSEDVMMGGSAPKDEIPDYVIRQDENSGATADLENESPKAKKREYGVLIKKPAKGEASDNLSVENQTSIKQASKNQASKKQTEEKAVKGSNFDEANHGEENAKKADNKEKRKAKSKVKATDNTNSSKDGENKKPGKVKKIIITAASILVAIVACIVIITSVSSRKINIGSYEIKKNTTFINVKDQTITDTGAKNLLKLTKLENMSFKNCDLGEFDFSTIKNKEIVKSIEIENCTGRNPVSGFDFSGFTNLKTLRIVNSSLTNADISNTFKEPGSFIRLSTVGFNDNEEVSGLFGTPVNGLTELNISNTAITDVSFLAGNKIITRLYMSGVKAVNMDPVYMMENLNELDISNCSAKDTDNKIKSLRIMKLDISGNDISSAEAFDDLTALKTLNIANTNITSVPFIEKNVETLEKLDISNTNLDENTLELIKDCTKLKELNISGINVGDDLSIIDNMNTLEKLSANSCGIKTIDSVKYHDALNMLLLKDNEIESITPLNDLVQKVVVDLRNNKVTSIGGLNSTNLQLLALNGNDVSIKSDDFNGAPNINNLVIDYTDDIFEDGVLDKIGGKEPGVYYLCVIDIPADKVVKFDNSFHRFYASYGDEKSVEEYLNKGFNSVNSYYWCVTEIGK